MILAILVLLGFVLTLQVVILWVVIRQGKRNTSRHSVVVNKVMETERNLLTLAKVFKVFEDETQILKKRNEAAAVRSRFTPR